MTKINFFTPISFEKLPKTSSQRDLENVDNYFFLGGRKACVLPSTNNRNACLSEPQKISLLTVVLKIISFCTLILPAIMVIAKAILRIKHKVTLVLPGSPLIPKAMPNPLSSPISSTTFSQTPPLVTNLVIPPNKNPDLSVTISSPSPTPDPSTPQLPFSKHRLSINTKRSTLPKPSPRSPMPAAGDVGTNALTVLANKMKAGTIKKSNSWKNTMRDAEAIAKKNTIRELAKGLNVTDAIIDEVQALAKDIVKKNTKNPPSNLQWIASPHKSNTLVFSLPTAPNVVFKIGNPKWDTAAALLGNGIGLDPNNVDFANEATSQRFENVLEVKKVIDKFKLDLLVLPKAKKFEIEYGGFTFVVVAEERLKFSQDINVQKKLYNDSRLMEAVKQMALLIGKTGFDDLEYRNAPILEEAPGYTGDPRIGLIDLDSMKNKDENQSIGLFGYPGYGRFPGRTGLVNMVLFDDQVRAIADIADELKIEDMCEAVKTRLETLAAMRKAAAALAPPPAPPAAPAPVVKPLSTFAKAMQSLAAKMAPTGPAGSSPQKPPRTTAKLILEANGKRNPTTQASA